ncbi:conserved exported hypothetical protein [Vibrio chagasii]|uniref:hypothetical protein n=1 Tax=Vibrio chagasii TaxID=170679 RepID=UPI000FE3B5AF|nr:hypothetical protein [Vibrio chagasii]CAH7121202.1 conserved exported hypothetical protein [Vibrio chagasii]
MKRYQQYLSLSLALVAFNSNALQCGAGKVEVDGVCVSSCKILQGTGKNLTWDSYIWGDNPRSYCIGDRSTGAACNMTPSTVSVSVEAGRWTNKFYYTGSTCNFDQINRYSGDTPEPFPFENDVNHNGVNDDLEDWDGDGTPNGEDPDPYKSDRVIVDDNSNGVPDSIDDFYDRLNDVNQPVGCDADDEDCHTYRNTMKHLTDNNRDLAGALRDLSLRSVRRTDFRESIGALVSTMNKNDGYFQSKLDALAAAQGQTQVSINDQLNRTESFLADRINDNSFTIIKKIDDVQTSVNYLTNVSRGTNSKVDDLINASSRDQNYFERAENDAADIKSAINDLLDGDGLTRTQKRQLKDGAEAKNNARTLRALESKIGFMERNLSNLPSNVSNSVNSQITPKLNELSNQIAAISSGSSTVDLSGVESSIQSLSDKIDGIDGADMSGVESKLTDLIDSVTNTNDFIEPNYDFDGVGFIVTQNQIAEAQNEVLELKQEMVEEFEKFKTLFSIDTSSFNNGTYKEHSLNLNVNHAERSFKSGVFEALLDNASFIAAVIMFLFVVSGIKMLGKD